MCNRDLGYSEEMAIEQLQKLLPEKEAVIIKEVGYEKFRYLTAYCQIITRDAVESIDLDTFAMDSFFFHPIHMMIHLVNSKPEHRPDTFPSLIPPVIPLLLHRCAWNIIPTTSQREPFLYEPHPVLHLKVDE